MRVFILSEIRGKYSNHDGPRLINRELLSPDQPTQAQRLRLRPPFRHCQGAPYRQLQIRTHGGRQTQRGRGHQLHAFLQAEVLWRVLQSNRTGSAHSHQVSSCTTLQGGLPRVHPPQPRFLRAILDSDHAYLPAGDSGQLLQLYLLEIQWKWGVWWVLLWTGLSTLWIRIGVCICCWHSSVTLLRVAFHRKSSSATTSIYDPIQLICTYGYGNTCFVLATLLCIIPLSFLQWILFLYAFANSTLFLVVCLRKHMEENQGKLIPVLGLVATAQFILFLCCKLIFVELKWFA